MRGTSKSKWQERKHGAVCSSATPSGLWFGSCWTALPNAAAPSYSSTFLRILVTTSSPCLQFHCHCCFNLAHTFGGPSLTSVTCLNVPSPVWLGNTVIYIMQCWSLLLTQFRTLMWNNAYWLILKKMFTTFLNFSSWLPLCQYLIRAHHHHMELILAHPYKSLWNQLLIHRFGQPTNIQKVNSLPEGEKK